MDLFAKRCGKLHCFARWWFHAACSDDVAVSVSGHLRSRGWYAADSPPQPLPCAHQGFSFTLRKYVVIALRQMSLLHIITHTFDTNNVFKPNFLKRTGVISKNPQGLYLLWDGTKTPFSGLSLESPGYSLMHNLRESSFPFGSNRIFHGIQTLKQPLTKPCWTAARRSQHSACL